MRRAYVLQAELQLLLVGGEVLGHLHCQVVEREDAVKERQHLEGEGDGLTPPTGRGRRPLSKAAEGDLNSGGSLMYI